MDVGNEDGTPNLERSHTTLHLTTMGVGNEDGTPNLERKSDTPIVTTMDVGNEDGVPNLEKRSDTSIVTVLDVGNEDGTPDFETRPDTTIVTTMDVGQVECTMDDLRKEKMKNYKRASQAQFVVANQIAREQLSTLSGPNGSTNSFSCNISYINRGDKRNISMLSKECVLTLVNQLCGYEVEYKKKVVEKMFGHELLRPMLPTFLLDVVRMKKNHQIVESIKSKMSTHLAQGKNNKHSATRELLVTLAFTESTRNKKIIKCLCLDRR